MSRLFVAAYDVRAPSRLARALRAVRAFASGGQYSAYECWLDRDDIDALEQRMRQELDLREDSFALIPLASRKPVAVLGVALPPNDPDLFYVE